MSSEERKEPFETDEYELESTNNSSEVVPFVMEL